MGDKFPLAALLAIDYFREEKREERIREILAVEIDRN